ncbi:MAG: efflux RND transporter periplasmic adaptor subunit [Candidatus Eremiobacteraeota bacterium]|nr:efflux RND transporter periplasmic adaptor subunit [Candidatus Eremiobacteraeota bacterium]
MKRHNTSLYAATWLALFVALAGCGKKDASPSTDQQALPVTVASARLGNIAEHLTLTGTVAARQQANISSAITGQVMSVNANVGDRVTAGEVLVKIDDSTLQAQLQQNLSTLAETRARLAQTQSGDVGNSASANANLQSAQVAYDTAMTTLRRNQQLLHQGYVSQSALEQAQQQAAAAQAQLRSAQVAAQNASLGGRTTSSAQSEIHSLQAAVSQAAASVQFIQAQIQQTVVTAPFSGVLTQRSVDPGALASPGTELVQVSQLDPVYVNIGIPEQDLPYIHPGTVVDVTLDALPGHTWHGTVSTVNAATTQGTLSYLARAVLPNPAASLRAGMVANGSFVKAQRRDVVLVPRAALFQNDAGDAVYVLGKAQGCKKCDGKAKAVNVHRGLQTDNESEVSGPGITPGTRVIIQRPDQLHDGSPVSVSSAGGRTQSSSQTLQ